MNFKLKALTVAAVATMTLSGAANAIPTSDMFLVAFDSATNKTFTADLGLVSAFSNTSVVTPLNFSADANWGSFISGATVSNIQYQVLGSDGLTNIWTTSNDVTSAGANSRMNQAIAGLTSPSGALNQFLAANTGPTNFIPATAGTGKGSEIGFDWTTFYNNFTTGAVLGQNDNFNLITKNGTKAVTFSTLTPFLQAAGGANSFWTLSTGGLLTYTGAASVAAVPEANTWAMMMLGLGFMGFVARRRNV